MSAVGKARAEVGGQAEISAAEKASAALREMTLAGHSIS